MNKLYEFQKACELLYHFGVKGLNEYSVKDLGGDWVVTWKKLDSITPRVQFGRYVVDRFDGSINVCVIDGSNDLVEDHRFYDIAKIKLHIAWKDVVK